MRRDLVVKWTDYPTRQDFERRGEAGMFRSAPREGDAIAAAPYAGCQWVLVKGTRKYACVCTKRGESYRIVSERVEGDTDV
jgi:hypothetical protein